MTKSESQVTYACHTLGNSDRGQIAAINERIFAYTCHSIGLASMGYSFRNYYSTRIIRNISIWVFLIISHVCFVPREVVIDTINVGIVSTYPHW